MGRWLVALAVTAAVAAAATAVVLQWRAAAVPQPPQPFTIAVNPMSISACAVLAAHHNGDFRAEGLDVRLQPHPVGRDALRQAMQGAADLATVADIPVMFAALRGEPVAVVANLFRSDRNEGIVGRKDRGVVLPGDLKGKRIGVPFGTSSHFVLDVFLQREGLARSDAEMIDMPPAALAAALAEGSIDAAVAWQPALEGMRSALGSQATMFYAERIYSASFLLAGSRERVRARDADVRRVLRAAARGAQFCERDPVAAAGLVTHPAGVNAASLLALWDDARFSVSLDQSLLLALEDEAQWAIGAGLARGPAPNFFDHFELRALSDVRPSAVTVIH